MATIPVMFGLTPVYGALSMTDQPAPNEPPSKRLILCVTKDESGDEVSMSPAGYVKINGEWLQAVHTGPIRWSAVWDGEGGGWLKATGPRLIRVLNQAAARFTADSN